MNGLVYRKDYVNAGLLRRKAVKNIGRCASVWADLPNRHSFRKSRRMFIACEREGELLKEAGNDSQIAFSGTDIQ
jgi:hypothetical protein